jgi:predicted nucleic acid-binding protein
VADVFLDTTFFIDLRKSQSTGADELWNQLADGSLTGAFSPITVYEPWVGQRMTREEELFYLSTMEIMEEVPFASDAARQAGIWLRGLAGTTAENRARDAMIAATAASRKEPVCTANLRDFQRFGIDVRGY